MSKKCLDINQAEKNGRVRAYTGRGCPTYSILTDANRKIIHYSQEAAKAYIAGYQSYQRQQAMPELSNIEKFNALLLRSFGTQGDSELCIEDGFSFETKNILFVGNQNDLEKARKDDEIESKLEPALDEISESTEKWIKNVFN